LEPSFYLANELRNSFLDFTSPAQTKQRRTCRGCVLFYGDLDYGFIVLGGLSHSRSGLSGMLGDPLKRNSGNLA
jgi:hypothetical protein